jgi:undecaprenyl-diphosphatase
MNFSHAILFAILQGASELFPVSSLGHAVIVPALLHWGINQADPSFVPFLALLHLGTAAGMLIYFRTDWIAMARGALGRGYAAEIEGERRLLILLVWATLPAVIIGLIVKKPIAHLFANPEIAAIFLILNAGVLLLGEKLRASGPKRGGPMTNKDAVIIGLFQCLAFLPGISRSGAAIVGALGRGARHEDAAKFSFLMGTPVIIAANVLELPRLIHHHGMLGISLIAAAVAGVVAYASTAFLMRYFRDHDGWALLPFAWYCAIAGTGSLALLFLGY